MLQASSLAVIHITNEALPLGVPNGCVSFAFDVVSLSTPHRTLQACVLSQLDFGGECTVAPQGGSTRHHGKENASSVN